MKRLPVVLLLGCMSLILSGCDIVAAVRPDGSAHVRVTQPAANGSCTTPVVSPDSGPPATRSGPSTAGGSVGPFPGTVVLEPSGRPLSYNSERPGFDRRLVWQNPNVVRARWTAHTGPTVFAAAVLMVGLAAVLFGLWKLRR